MAEQQTAETLAYVDPELDLFSDEMDTAVNAYVTVRHGITRNAEAAGEKLDGERVMRRCLAAAIKGYLGRWP